MKAKWYHGSVIRIQDESPTTKRFWLQVHEVQQLDFVPGQFIVTDLPLGEKRKQRWRSYSIANAPDGTDIIELCIVHLEGGSASDYFWNHVSIGTKIRFKEPSGTFTIPKNLDRTNVMIATGTGVAPFRSMLMHIQEKKIQHGPIHLIFGTRFADGILYRDQLAAWAAQDPNFSYSIALSRLTAEDIQNLKLPLDIRSGYVHPIYMGAYNNRKDAHFYICGWSDMIDETVANLLLKMSIPKENIHYELYG